MTMRRTKYARAWVVTTKRLRALKRKYTKTNIVKVDINIVGTSELIVHKFCGCRLWGNR